MIGLVAKDFIVFKKICKPAYRLLGIILLPVSYTHLRAHETIGYLGCRRRRG